MTKPVEVTQAKRTPAELRMFAAWMNVHIGQVPCEYGSHLNEVTRKAWKRVYVAANQEATRELVEAINDALPLIEEAKGFEGERGGPISDHLDLADSILTEALAKHTGGETND